MQVSRAGHAGRFNVSYVGALHTLERAWAGACCADAGPASTWRASATVLMLGRAHWRLSRS